ncbi:hypothetical protein RJ639_034291 [Escallonia herrerae]|uniref:Uncharacterized protein n=1 Tax=Escallonia herrerae TaxID=1293975 RepID=A0AA89BJM6_9ASTE|nr:hypothetical protein RJ639_034291 [Escallonia herrerae]
MLFPLSWQPSYILLFKAEKCRQLVGEEAASKSGQFTFLNCFDGSSGTVACAVKEGVKLYFYNIRAARVERARHHAIETALVDALSEGLNAKDAAKQAQKEGAKAAKLAIRKAKRIIGPIISSGWDFFEAIYFGGTLTEGFLRGTGTLLGTYGIGFLGEQRFGRFGYLVGSHLGSWVGGRIGLMVYDVVNGVQYLLQFVQPEETRAYETSSYNKDYDTPAFGSSEVSEDSYVDEAPIYTSFDTSVDSNVDESPAYESSEAHEDL